MRSFSGIFLAWSLACLLTACATSSVPAVSKKNTSVFNPDSLPDKLLVLPVKVRVHEVFAGGMVEMVPEWSAQAKAALETSLAAQLSQQAQGQLMGLPELSAAETKLLHEHLLLYGAVSSSAFLHTNFPAYGWSHKVDSFDYTLGPGLSFLREKTGAEAALLLFGADYISTKGRVAMMTMASLVGVAMPPGSSHLQLGVVELQTGDLLWLRQKQVVGNRDLRKPADARLMISELFSGDQP